MATYVFFIGAITVCRSNVRFQGPTLSIGIEDADCLGDAPIFDNTQPGGHSAAGDKAVKHVVGAQKIGVQALKPGDTPAQPAPQAAENALSSSEVTVPASATLMSTISAIPLPSIDSSSEVPLSIASNVPSASAQGNVAALQHAPQEEGEFSDNECDEL